MLFEWFEWNEDPMRKHGIGFEKPSYRAREDRWKLYSTDFTFGILYRKS